MFVQPVVGCRAHSTRWLAFVGAIVGTSASLAVQGAEPPAAYRESMRPLVHFTAQANWINDPNGLVFFDGEYHLFFQHDPTNLDGSAFKSWGHAVSRDLVHWRQMNDALTPDELGSIWSGSAVVDWHDTAGFQTGAEPPLVAVYTAAGGFLAASEGRPFTQALAFSNDRGRSWYKHAGNPVLEEVAGGNRDPKVGWHEPTKRWIMALYLADDRFALFASPDLKTWEHLQELRVPGSSECPDFFEMPVAGEAGVSRWIFWTANNAYVAGSFDGHKFVPEGEPLRGDHGPCYYAAQTFSDVPAADGRRIQIAWMRGPKYAGMRFNQQLSIPTTLTLRPTQEGLRLHRAPVAELATLRGQHRQWSGKLAAEARPCVEIGSDAFEVLASIDVGEAQGIVISIHGTRLHYDVAKGRLSLPESEADVPLDDGRLRLHIIADRTSAEVFAAGGLVTLARCFEPALQGPRLTLAGEGATVESLEAWDLASLWDVAAD